MSQDIVVGWKTAGLNPNIASLRYRALFPLIALEKQGVKNKICSRVNRSFLKGLDALIIVKSFKSEDVWLAQEAFNLSIPVVFDLCDNIFIEGYGGDSGPSDIFLSIASVASAITVTTEPLASVVRERIGDRVPIYIIPDGIENRCNLNDARRRLFFPKLKSIAWKPVVMVSSVIQSLFDVYQISGVKGALRKIYEKFHALFNRCLKLVYGIKTKLVDRFSLTAGNIKCSINAEEISAHSDPVAGGNSCAQSSKRKKILWFGNHGASHASFGMTDLLLIKKELEAIAADIPVELIIVSNNQQKFIDYIKPMAIPTQYYEWKAESMSKHFLEADLVVIPCSKDDFSICKSANRSVLAISNGLPVVATSTAALNDLRDVMVLDDFEVGIRRYLSDFDFVTNHIQNGKELIQQLYGQGAIGELWLQVINDVVAPQNTDNTLKRKRLDLIVAVQLPQDLSLAFPVLEEVENKGLVCEIWTSIEAVKKWPILLSEIKKQGLGFRLLPQGFEKMKGSLFPNSTLALLSITESNLGPHRFTHMLTKSANKEGLVTATMQHGFENIGLTYSDSVHNIKKIRFESKRIYLWGSTSQLHPDIPMSTLAKCIPAGCLKAVSKNCEQSPLDSNDYEKKIGVFENLHWHRYSEGYRQGFLDAVDYVSKCFPEVLFVVKPHNAGMWLSRVHQGGQPKSKNILIADPLADEWKNVSAENLFTRVDAVITTPSTIALDSARARLPTAVYSREMSLDNYKPLSILKNNEDWKSFIEQTFSCRHREDFLGRASDFVAEVLLDSNNSAAMIVGDLTENTNLDIRNKDA